MTTVDTSQARTQLARRDPRQTAINDAKKDLAGMGSQFALVLPEGFKAERLVRVLQTVVSINPDLAAPDKRAALLGAAMTCAQLGLDPTPAIGHAYIVPFGGQPTFVLGYKGAVFLAADHGISFTTDVIRENDVYDVVRGTSEKLEHRYPPFNVARGRALAYYCVAHFSNGLRPKFEVMTLEEVEKIRQNSPGKNSPAWKNHFDEMARKTVLKRLAKNVPIGTKLAQASAHDETVRIDRAPEVLEADNYQATDDNEVADAEIIPDDDDQDYDPETGEVIPPGVGIPR
jgi:recombination protein RecT